MSKNPLNNAWRQIDYASCESLLDQSGLAEAFCRHVNNIILEERKKDSEFLCPVPSDSVLYWVDFTDLNNLKLKKPIYRLKPVLPDGTALPGNDIDIELPPDVHAELMTYVNAEWPEWAERKRIRDGICKQAIGDFRQYILSPAKQASDISSEAFNEIFRHVINGNDLHLTLHGLDPLLDDTPPKTQILKLIPKVLAAGCRDNMELEKKESAARRLHAELMGVEGPENYDKEYYQALSSDPIHGKSISGLEQLIKDISSCRQINRDLSMAYRGIPAHHILSTEDLLMFVLLLRQLMQRLQV